MGNDSPTASPNRTNSMSTNVFSAQSSLAIFKRFRKNLIVRARDNDGGKANGANPNRLARSRLTDQSETLMKKDREMVPVEGPEYPHRIINTHTLEFETDCVIFKDSYATFSHTWTQDGAEVDFPEGVKLLARTNSVRIMKGLRAQEEQWDIVARKGGKTPDHETIPNLTLEEAKLLRAVKAAKELGFKYLWVDNCCIDKADNTELTEALSSMGKWYANAAMCLVYLEDCTKTSTHFTNDISTGVVVASEHSFRWATRGWTLQEIVMSRRATFYNKFWERILDTAEHLIPVIKDTDVLNSTLSNLCRVPPQLVCYGQKPNIPTAVLMSMASKRNTTRVEDRVYSLLGMLGVRMEAHYGEGLARAVERLFDKLIESGMADASMFNWLGKDRGNTAQGRSMYPVDFDGYDTPGSIIMEARDFDPEPLSIPGSLKLGLCGIYSCFDVYPIPRVNMELGKIDANSTNETGIPDRSAAAEHTDESPIRDSMVTSSCRIQLDTGIVVKAKLSCPISIANSIAGITEFSGHTSSTPVEWVLAKFSGVQGADWFLSCLTTTQSTFANPETSTGTHGSVGICVKCQSNTASSNPSQGVTGGLLHARRIPTNSFSYVQSTAETKLTSSALNEIVRKCESGKIKTVNMVMG